MLQEPPPCQRAHMPTARDDAGLTHAHCVCARITLARRLPEGKITRSSVLSPRQGFCRIGRLKRDPSHPGDKRATVCTALSASIVPMHGATFLENLGHFHDMS